MKGIGKFLASRKARKAAPYDRTIAKPCAANGHTYKIHETGWRCAICGNHVPRLDGELYGPADEGRVERRREDR